jgi:type I restriction enzyme S subunit
MSSDWRDTTLGEFVRLQRGHDLTATEQKPGKVPIMGSAGPNGTHSTARASGPGVAVGRSGGSAGRVHFSEVDYWPHNTCLYVTDFLGNNPRYCYYLLQTLNLASFNSGSAQASINRNFLYPIKLCVPGRPGQDRIAALLQSIDHSITSAHQTNAALESIAQTLFRSWFVDFDPVHAKASGTVPEAMSAELAALFPSEFEASDLGLIPKEWQVKSVKDICQRIANGSTPSRGKPQFWGAGHNWFKTGELADTFLLDAKEEITEEGLAGSSAKVFPRHSVLMAIYAAPTVGRLGVLTKPATFNQAATGMFASADVGPWFLYQALYHGRAWFNNRSNGAAQQNISKDIVEGYPVIVPSKEVLQAFNKVANPLYAAIEGNAHLVDNLVRLRDHMLPRLISGKLRIEDGESAVAELTSSLETEPV